MVGSPGKTFNVAFDTTWTYSWLMSSECEMEVVGCWFHNKYNHHKSSSYSKVGTKFNMNVGSYNLTGFFSNDTFAVGRTNRYKFLMMLCVYLFRLVTADLIIKRS